MHAETQSCVRASKRFLYNSRADTVRRVAMASSRRRARAAKRKRVARADARERASSQSSPKNTRRRPTPLTLCQSRPTCSNGASTFLRRTRPWVSDITYLWTRHGWLYLAVIVDLYSRKVVGWSLRERMTADLVCEALDAAVRARRARRKMVRGFSISTCGRHGRTSAQALAGSVQGRRRRVRAPASDRATDPRPHSNQGGAEVLGICDRVHGHVCSREQQTVRAIDESLHPEASLASGVRRHATRCHQDASDRSLESELARQRAESEAGEQHPCLPRQDSTHGAAQGRAQAHRHLKSDLVFCHPDGKPLTQSAIEAALRSVCSTLGSRWAVPKALQFEVARSNGNISGEGGLRTLGRISPTSA